MLVAFVAFVALLVVLGMGALLLKKLGRRPPSMLPICGYGRDLGSAVQGWQGQGDAPAL